MRLLIFSLFLFVQTNLFAQFQQELEQIIATEKKAFSIGYKNAGSQLNRSHFDVKSQVLNLTVNPDTHYIEGSVKTTFEFTQTNQPSIVLDLSDRLTLDSIKSATPILWNHKNNQIKIDFNSQVATNQSYQLELFYHGNPDAGRAFTTDSVKDGKVLWTLSEPYGAMEWWPCKQDLQDKIEHLEFNITHPDSLTAVANGLKTKEVLLANNLKRSSFEHHYPIVSYLVAFSVAKYEVLTDSILYRNQKLPFVNYVYPSSKTEAIRDLKNFDKTLFLFDSLFGEYPFKKELYGHAQFSWGGGMEHQTMSFMYNFNHGLVAHELAHQWFGDKITCGSWQDLWLNEGFATYATGLTYQSLFKGNEWLQWRQQTLRAATQVPDGSVWIEDTTNVSRMFSSSLTYNKGAYLLHMLRFKMGDENFFNALKSYLQDNNLKYGFARTENLKFHLKQHGEEGIDEFFNDWYYKKGFPNYEVEWFQNRDQKLYVVVKQSQSYVWEGTFFDMDLPIKIIGNGIDTTVVMKNNKPVQELIIPVDKKVMAVSFDPELWILAGEKSVKQVEHKPELIGYQLAPNPTTNQLRVFASAPNLPHVNLAIIDIQGRQVWQGKATQGLSSDGFLINTSALKAGTYFLKISDYFQTQQLKFVKVNE